MADLNDLKQFEDDLKKRIGAKQTSVTQYPSTASSMHQTLMGIEEHGQPFQSRGGNNPISMQTYMAVREHGQPYKGTMTTRMAIGEHGQPYKNN